MYQVIQVGCACEVHRYRVFLVSPDANQMKFIIVFHLCDCIRVRITTCRHDRVAARELICCLV